MEFPTDRNYTSTHEWIQSDNATAIIGISDFAQSELGDLVFVNLPEVGDELSAGEPFADVESVKAVSEIISPVSGVVAHINEELLDAPELINQSPYDAWFIKVDSPSETLDTLSAAEYQAQHINQE